MIGNTIQIPLKLDIGHISHQNHFPLYARIIDLHVTLYYISRLSQQFQFQDLLPLETEMSFDWAPDVLPSKAFHHLERELLFSTPEVTEVCAHIQMVFNFRVAKERHQQLDPHWLVDWDSIWGFNCVLLSQWWKLLHLHQNIHCVSFSELFHTVFGSWLKAILDMVWFYDWKKELDGNINRVRYVIDFNYWFIKHHVL